MAKLEHAHKGTPNQMKARKRNAGQISYLQLTDDEIDLMVADFNGMSPDVRSLFAAMFKIEVVLAKELGIV